jgi:DNA-binding protein HU-beta/integration host factor subunit beta
VTKKEMAKTIAEEMSLTQQQVQEVVQRVLDGITETLLQEGRIELRIFGVFEVRKRKLRKARNPRTGEKVKVPAKRVVIFRPGQEMGQRVGQLQTLPNGGSAGCPPCTLPSLRTDHASWRFPRRARRREEFPHVVADPWRRRVCIPLVTRREQTSRTKGERGR